MCRFREDRCAPEKPSAAWQRGWRDVLHRIRAARVKSAEREARRERAARRVWLEDGAFVITPEQFEESLPPYSCEGGPAHPAYYKTREIRREGRRPCTLLDIVRATVRSLVTRYRMDPYHDYAEVLGAGINRCFLARSDNKVIGLRPHPGETAEDAFERYVPTIFSNAAHDHARALRGTATNPEAVALAGSFDLFPAPAPTPLLELEWLEECSIVFAEIDRMPRDYAEVFSLRTVDERPWAEVAAYLGVTIAGAFARHARACRHLLGRLSERLGWGREVFPGNSEGRAENNPLQQF